MFLLLYSLCQCAVLICSFCILFLVTELISCLTLNFFIFPYWVQFHRVRTRALLIARYCECVWYACSELYSSCLFHSNSFSLSLYFFHTFTVYHTLTLFLKWIFFFLFEHKYALSLLKSLFLSFLAAIVKKIEVNFLRQW